MFTIQDWEFLQMGGEEEPQAVNRWFYNNYVLYGCNPDWLMELFWTELIIDGQKTSFRIDLLHDFIDAQYQQIRGDLNILQWEDYILFIQKINYFTPILYAKYMKLTNSIALKAYNTLRSLNYSIFLSWRRYCVSRIHHYPTWGKNWANGMANLSFWNSEFEESRYFELGWTIPNFSSLRVGFTFGGERQMSFNIGFGLATFSACARLFSNKTFKWICSKLPGRNNLFFHPRSLEAGFHHGTFFLNLFSDKDYEEGYYLFNVLDWVFGETKRECCAIVENVPFTIKMPEKDYAGIASYSIINYRRSRLPFLGKRSMGKIELELYERIPIHGNISAPATLTARFSIYDKTTLNEVVEGWQKEILERRKCWC